MPAPRGEDQTANNLSAAAEPWVKPVGKRIKFIIYDPEVPALRGGVSNSK
jgi:hypothetical protein